MRCLTEYIQLLAQREDFDNWINILFVVILAIFWLVGGLVKAMSKNRQQPDTKSQPKPLMRSKDFRQSRSHKPPPVPSTVRPTSQPQPRKHSKVGTRPRPVSHKPVVNLAAQPEYPSKAMFIDQPDLSKSPTLMQKPRSEAVSLQFLDLYNPQELRRAVIHYEIFGKPLALRGPYSPPF
jgi:hypothetical protein